MPKDDTRTQTPDRQRTLTDDVEELLDIAETAVAKAREIIGGGFVARRTLRVVETLK